MLLEERLFITLPERSLLAGFVPKTRLSTHTHTHTQSSQTALCHGEGSGNYAGQVECLFPSTTGGFALNTHIHTHTHTLIF